MIRNDRSINDGCYSIMKNEFINRRQANTNSCNSILHVQYLNRRLISKNICLADILIRTLLIEQDRISCLIIDLETDIEIEPGYNLSRR